MSGAPKDVPLLSTLRYEQISAGESWGPFVERIDPETADRTRAAIGASVPGSDVPPGALPLVTLRVMRRALQGIPPGGVLARLRFSIFDSLQADEPIDVGVWVSAQHRASGRLFTTFTFSLAQRGIVPAMVEWMVLAPPAQDDEALSTTQPRRAGDSPKQAVVEQSPSDPAIGSAPGRWKAFPRVTHVIGRSMIDEYAELSGDYNPLHMDEQYARSGPFGAVIAHGPIALQTAFEAVGVWLGPGRLPAGITIDVSFRKPVLVDDEITCRPGAWLDHGGTVVVPLSCRNQAANEVLQVLVACPRHFVPRAAAPPLGADPSAAEQGAGG